MRPRRRTEIDNLEQLLGATSDRVDDLAQSSVGEGLADARRVDRAHAVARSVLSVTFDGSLHRDASVEDDIYQRRDREEAGDRRERGVLAQRVAGEGAAVLDETFGAQIFERGLLRDDERDLSELRRKEQTGRRRERVARCAQVDVGKQGLRLDVAFLVGDVVE